MLAGIITLLLINLIFRFDPSQAREDVEASADHEVVYRSNRLNATLFML